MGYDLVSLTMHPSSSENLYYCFSNISMANVLHVLNELGVIDNSFPQPAWPEFPGESHFDDKGEPLTDAARVYLTQREEVLRAHRRNGRVPFYKFCSNDGWLVTPEECLAIADAVKQAGREKLEAIAQAIYPDPEDRKRFVERLVGFGQFCEDCARLGGFHVY